MAASTWTLDSVERNSASCRVVGGIRSGESRLGSGALLNFLDEEEPDWSLDDACPMLFVRGDHECISGREPFDRVGKFDFELAGF